MSEVWRHCGRCELSANCVECPTSPSFDELTRVDDVQDRECQECGEVFDESDNSNCPKCGSEETELYLESNVTVSSSHGHYIINPQGGILEDITNKEYQIKKFDVEEFKETYGKLNSDIDILDLGYWCVDGTYEPPAEDWRKEVQELRKGG